VNELVRPELEGGVLDQLNEGYQEPPGMWPVDNQSLQEDSCDLFLNSLCVCLSEQVEETAGEVVGVGVGVPQLVGDTVEEQVAALGVHVHRQVLEDVHVAAVGDRGDAGALALGPNVLDSLGANIHDKSIDHGDVVSHPSLGCSTGAGLEVGSQL